MASLIYRFPLILCLATFSMLPCIAASDDIGLLLTTPAERETIRQWREQGTAIMDLPEKSQAVVSESGILYNGMVITSRGRTSHWVNGQWVRTPEDAQQLGVSFKPDIDKGLEVISIDRKRFNQSIFIKPGETHDRHAGRLSGRLRPRETDASVPNATKSNKHKQPE